MVIFNYLNAVVGSNDHNVFISHHINSNVPRNSDKLVTGRKKSPTVILNGTSLD